MRTCKNKLLFVWICLLSLTGSLGFVSCSDDGKDEPVIIPDVKKYPYFLFEVSLSDDLFSIASPVTVTYTNEQGTEVEETLTNKNWKKAFTGKSFPYTACYTMTFTTDETKWTQDSYSLGYSTSMTTALTDAEGNFYSVESVASQSSSQVKKENLQRYFSLLNGRLHVRYVLNENGHAEAVPETSN